MPPGFLCAITTEVIVKINKIITANPVVKALTRCLRKNPRASARFFSTPALPPATGAGTAAEFTAPSPKLHGTVKHTGDRGPAVKTGALCWTFRT